MAITLEITITGARGLDAALSAIIPHLRADMLEGAALFTEREARLAAPRDTSALARSIHSQVTAAGAVSREATARIGTNLAYAPVMEFGRPPGGRMPPPAALRGWARRHGMAGFEFVIARAIARRGIKGRFFMKKAADRLVSHGFGVVVPRAVARSQNRWRSAGKD